MTASPPRTDAPAAAPPVLHYIHDPLCGWCYAAAPLAEAAAEAGVEVALHGGGLWDRPQSYPPGMEPRIRGMEDGIARTTGQPYGEAYRNGLLGDPATVLHSRPPISAVLAAERVRPGSGLAMLHAVQAAHFVDGRRIVEPAVLASLAADLGLDAAAFAEASAAADVGGHIAETRALMRRVGADGFPTFVLQTAGASAPLPHAAFYGRPGDFVWRLEAVAQELGAQELGAGTPDPG